MSESIAAKAEHLPLAAEIAEQIAARARRSRRSRAYRAAADALFSLAEREHIIRAHHIEDPLCPCPEQ